MISLCYSSNFYSPPMHVPYHGGPPVLPVGGMPHYRGHQPYPSVHHPHHPIGPPHIQPNHMNGYHVAHYESANVPSIHHPNATFGATPNMIPHSQPPSTQSTASSIPTTLSKDEFYLKQRSLQRM